MTDYKERLDELDDFFPSNRGSIKDVAICTSELMSIARSLHKELIAAQEDLVASKTYGDVMAARCGEAEKKRDELRDTLAEMPRTD